MRMISTRKANGQSTKDTTPLIHFISLDEENQGEEGCYGAV